MPANDQFHFSMKDYSAGIYFIELLQDGKTNRVKIIIL
jgi:hypothetical protein